MSAMASHITSLPIVYSAIYSGAYQRKHQRPASLAVTGEFPAQRASNAENVSIWWRHHVHANGFPQHVTLNFWERIEYENTFSMFPNESASVSYNVPVTLDWPYPCVTPFNGHMSVTPWTYDLIWHNPIITLYNFTGSALDLASEGYGVMFHLARWGLVTLYGVGNHGPHWFK